MLLIGVDPHKATHCAVAISSDKRPSTRLQVRSMRHPAGLAVNLARADSRSAHRRAVRPLLDLTGLTHHLVVES